MAELLDRIHPEPDPLPPVEPEQAISVDALLRREGRSPIRRPGGSSTALAAGAVLATGAVVGITVFTDAPGGNDSLGAQDGTQHDQDQHLQPVDGQLTSGERATIVDAAARSATLDRDVASASNLAGLALPQAPAAAGPDPAPNRRGGEIRSSAASSGATSGTSGGTADADAGSGSRPPDSGSTSGGADSNADGAGSSSDGAEPSSDGRGSGSDDDHQPTDSVQDRLDSVGGTVDGAVSSGTSATGNVLESATGTVDVVTGTTGGVLDDTSDLVASTTDPVNDLIGSGQRTTGALVGHSCATTGRTTAQVADTLTEQPDVDPVIDPVVDPVIVEVIPANKHHRTVWNGRLSRPKKNDSTSPPVQDGALSSLDNLTSPLQKVTPNSRS